MGKPAAWTSRQVREAAANWGVTPEGDTLFHKSVIGVSEIVRESLRTGIDPMAVVSAAASEVECHMRILHRPEFYSAAKIREACEFFSIRPPKAKTATEAKKRRRG